MTCERPSFRLGIVAGVIPTRWARTWRERLPQVDLEIVGLAAAGAAGRVRSGEVDAGLIRLPPPSGDPPLSVIPLYAEIPVVVVPTDHYLCAAEEVQLADLADEPVLAPAADGVDWQGGPAPTATQQPATTAEAVALVAAGLGVVIVPLSLARLHHRKDLTYRPVTDLPESRVGLVWVEGSENERIEDLIGIVRGRTPNSSRGVRAPAPKRTAAQKAAARRERRGTAPTAGRGSGTSPRRRPRRRGR